MFESNIKIGVSIKPRKRLQIISSENHIVFKGNVELISTIEYDIKMKFHAIESHEWYSIDDKNQILSFINQHNLLEVQIIL